MTYQAGHRNFKVATGADSRFAIRFHRGGDLVDASTVTVDDFIVYQGTVWPVSSVTPSSGKVTIRLGKGAFYEPELTLNDDDQVQLAPAAVWSAVDMQVAMPDTPETPPPMTQAVPTSITDEGLTCLIEIGQTWLEEFQRDIDYSAAGPSGMSLPYDLTGEFDGQRIHVLTGTIAIVRSAASPVVSPPEVPA